METVSKLKLIREMDADELIEYFILLKEDYISNLLLIKEIKKQYKQLTGEELYALHGKIFTI